jgi:hypothetical protein
MPVWVRGLLFAAVVTGGCACAVALLWRGPTDLDPPVLPEPDEGILAMAAEVDAAFAAAWARTGETPAGLADDLAVVRRLSLGLRGVIPSYEELRWLETIPENRRRDAWLERMFRDPRYGETVAERLARACVGTENGPFLVYRRRRFTDWLAREIQGNRPYDALARDLIAGQGTATGAPATNFVARTVIPDQGIEVSRLAARTSRAFLGIRLDCVECHDDFLEGKWRQADFHGLAAWFADTELTFTGVSDTGKKAHEVRFRGTAVPVPVPPAVPFGPEWIPEEGRLRERLAAWVTHPGNRAFARTAVNRTWALLFGQPLVAPVDRIPLEGPFPPGLERLADDFVTHGHDLRRLIRVLAATELFRRESLGSAAPPPEAGPGEEARVGWTSFPLTRLRPDQMARAIHQISSLASIDHEAHVFLRIERFGQTRDFVARYGDPGEDEFTPSEETVPQRLLLLNGKMVREHTRENPVRNASSRIGFLARDEESAVAAAYLAVLTRLPSAPEREHFVRRLREAPGKARGAAMEDLFWSLVNASEFSWNH